jgi:hypothetical protein
MPITTTTITNNHSFGIHRIAAFSSRDPLFGGRGIPIAEPNTGRQGHAGSFVTLLEWMHTIGEQRWQEATTVLVLVSLSFSFYKLCFASS